MGWKDLSAWLKGGIILSSFYTIFSILFYFLVRLFVQGEAGLIILWSFVPSIVFLSRLADNDLMAIISFLLNIVFYFGVGSFIGWLVGKIKSRNE